MPEKSIAERFEESIAAQHEIERAEAMVADAGATAAILTALDAIQPRVEMTDNVPIEKQLYSLGYVCQLFQSPPALVRQVAKRAGVEFALVLNDVPHFDGRGVLQMNRYLRDVREGFPKP